jgi:hypothetical protein
MATSIGLRLFKPQVWTFEAEILQNCLCAILATLFAVKAVKHGLASLVELGVAIGLCAVLYAMPRHEHWAYRGIALLDLIVALLLLSTWKAIGISSSTSLYEVCLDRLRLVFSARALYYAAFELDLALAWWLGLLSTTIYCWAMFGIADKGFSGDGGSPPNRGVYRFRVAA